MKVYTRRSSQPLKWIVAIVVFLLAMGVTFDDVYGEDPGTPDQGTVRNENSYDDRATQSTDGDLEPVNGDDPSTPQPIPEPTTIILLGSGIGAMYAVRRWRRKVR